MNQIAFRQQELTPSLSESPQNASRQIVRVEILNLEETKYGPAQNMSRQAWRDVCWTKLNTPHSNFQQWSQVFSTSQVPLASFSVRLHYDDGTTEIADEELRPCTSLDFVGHTISDLLEHRIFGWHALFNYCTFKVPLDADSFQGVARFDSATFENKVHLGSFAQHACFQRAIFKQVATFTGGWTQGADFSEAVFATTASFSSGFGRATSFARTKFFGDASFAGTHFGADADFGQAEFFGDAKFNITNFKGLADFRLATFKGDALFNHAEFAAGASFEQCEIHGPAQFKSVEFGEDVSFSFAQMWSSADFYGADFSHKSEFENTFFGEECSFENARLKNVGHFERAQFMTKSPSFLGVEQKTTLIFRGTKFPRAIGTANEVEHYTALKQLAESQGHHEQALLFNALEHASRRRSRNESPVFNFTAYLYEKLSDYGRSLSRPLLWFSVLLGLNFSIACVHAAINAPASCDGKKDGWADLWRTNAPCSSPNQLGQGGREGSGIYLTGVRAAVEHTLIGAIGLVEFPGKDKQVEPINRRLFGQAYESPGFRIWSVMRSILGPALLFLAALALRNKYRLK